MLKVKYSRPMTHHFLQDSWLGQLCYVAEEADVSLVVVVLRLGLLQAVLADLVSLERGNPITTINIALSPPYLVTLIYRGTADFSQAERTLDLPEA